jgi:predicted MPP superfamily phosphohydrolase
MASHERSRQRHKRGWLSGALALSAIWIVSMSILQYTPLIERVTVGRPEGADDAPLVIVQLSDLHIDGWRDVRRLAHALTLVSQARPDVIVITGDFVLDHAEALQPAIPLLTSLSAPLGVYAVLGNHDLWSDRHAVTAALRASGITVLDNSGTKLTRGEISIFLAGLDDPWSGTPDLDAALAGNTAGLPVVLLLHEPDLGHDYVESGRAWLLLAGHSHGGQVRIPGRGPLVLPAYARRYTQGLYPVGDGWIYVNRGIGMATIPIRLFCRPEVTVLTIYPPQPTP